MAKYVISLTAKERAQLTELISKGHRAALVLTRARILLKAKADDEGPHWTVPAIAEGVWTTLKKTNSSRG